MIVNSTTWKPFSRSEDIEEWDSTETYADLARWARCPSTARVQLLFLDPILIGLDGHQEFERYMGILSLIPHGWTGPLCSPSRRHVVLTDSAPIGIAKTCYLGSAVKPNRLRSFWPQSSKHKLTNWEESCNSDFRPFLVAESVAASKSLSLTSCRDTFLQPIFRPK